MNQKKIAGILTVAATLSMLLGCGGTQTSKSGDDSRNLVIVNDAVMTGMGDHYAAIVGKEKGFYEKYGIDLQVTEYAYGINTLDAVVNGTADIGFTSDYATVNRLGNTIKDTNLKIFSLLFDSMNSIGGLYTSPEYVKDPASLDGSEGFIVHIGTAQEYFLDKALTYLNLKIDNQNILNPDSSQTDLALIEQKRASAIFAEGSLAQKVEDSGWQLLASYDEMGLVTSGYLLSREDYIENNTEILSDFLQAMQESFDYINENQDEAVDIIVKATGANAEDVKKNFQTYNFGVGMTQKTYDHLQEINNWAYANGKYDTEYDIKDFITTDVLNLDLSDRVTLK